jgi:hypothetical protein
MIGEELNRGLHRCIRSSINPHIPTRRFEHSRPCESYPQTWLVDDRFRVSPFARVPARCGLVAVRSDRSLSQSLVFTIHTGSGRNNTRPSAARRVGDDS